MHNNSFRPLALAITFVVLPAAVFGQRLSVGFAGGTNLTRDLPTTGVEYLDSDYPSGLSTALYFSDSRNLIVGPTMDVAISNRFSVEVDGLHRNLQLQFAFVPAGGQRQNEGTIDTIGTWEFPLLLKYKLPLAKVQPFVEMGPSFRTRTNPGPSYPSSYGVSVGVGAEFLLKSFRIAPVVRYTRWASDPHFPVRPTNPDQVEILAEISHATPLGSSIILAGRVRLGVVVGIAPTDWLGANPYPEEDVTVMESPRYLVGLMAGVNLGRHISVEVDGIYRPLQEHVTFADGFVAPFSVLTWQVPVLARYELSERHLRPFVEAGPSFRLSGNQNGFNPSPVGITAGAGLAAHLRFIRVEPTVRYTRWAADHNYSQTLTNPNQVELLVGFSF